MNREELAVLAGKWNIAFWVAPNADKHDLHMTEVAIRDAIREQRGVPTKVNSKARKASNLVMANILEEMKPLVKWFRARKCPTKHFPLEEYGTCIKPEKFWSKLTTWIDQGEHCPHIQDGTIRDILQMLQKLESEGALDDTILAEDLPLTAPEPEDFVP